MNPSDRDGKPAVSEIDIHALADNLLPADRAASVGGYLHDFPAEARRAAFYQKLNRQIYEAFGTSEDKFSSPADARAVARAAQRRSWLRRIRMFSIVLMLGVVLAGGGVAFMLSRVPDQALENASLMALEAAPQQPAAGTMPPGRQAGAPDLSAVGFHLEATRRMRVGMFTYARTFIYRNAAQQPAVLLARADFMAADHPQWRAMRVGKVRLLMWSRGGVKYVLAGDADAHGLMVAADLASGTRSG